MPGSGSASTSGSPIPPASRWVSTSRTGCWTTHFSRSAAESLTGSDPEPRPGSVQGAQTPGLYSAATPTIERPLAGGGGSLAITGQPGRSDGTDVTDRTE